MGLHLFHRVEFQSTHPVRGGTCGRRRPYHRSAISIHPPRAGWDWRRARRCITVSDFNPPTPCGVGRAESHEDLQAGYFNPPTPCGVGPDAAVRSIMGVPISIHPPRAGWDSGIEYPIDTDFNFNPPTPCGVGPPLPFPSLLALRYFNPPTPCGVGRINVYPYHNAIKFQSTHPVRGGTPPSDGDII